MEGRVTQFPSEKTDRLNGPYTIPLGPVEPLNIMSYGQGPDGEIYFTESFGRIFWFAPK